MRPWVVRVRAPAGIVSTATRYTWSAPSSVYTRGSPSGPSTTKASTSPCRMARTVSSASASRARKSRTSRSRSPAAPRLLPMALLPLLSDVEPNEDALPIGHAAHQPPKGLGELLDQRGGGDDLPLLGDDGLLVDVDHL
jgi:hypothetical protein